MINRHQKAIAVIGGFLGIIVIGLVCIAAWLVIPQIRTYFIGVATPPAVSQPLIATPSLTFTPVPLTQTPSLLSTPTFTPEPSPTLTHTSQPTPLTSTPVADSQYHLLSLDAIGNDSVSNNYHPDDLASGEIQLGGVPFFVLSSFGTQGSPLPERPTSAVLELDEPIPNPDKVFLLINSGNTFTHFQNQQLGLIELRFENGQAHITPLIVGQNIREWSFKAPNVVATLSSSEIQNVVQTDTAVLDMLTITVPEPYNNSSLDEIRFIDTSVDSVGSLDPGFFVAGVTVKQD